MNSVLDIRTFFASRAVPTLVLLDLQQEFSADSPVQINKDWEDAIRNCRDALSHARRMNFPVAFVRWSGRSPFFDAATIPARGTERFKPQGSDMVFERDKPSCFSSPLFADVMSNVEGPIVLAGFSGEASCLSTAIDAFHRGHNFIFLNDASASHPVSGMRGDKIHAVLTEIIRLYGAVADTQGWVRSTSKLTLVDRQQGASK